MSDTDTIGGASPPGFDFTGGTFADPTTDSGAPDQVTEVSSQSWLGRLRDSLMGSVIGMILVIAAVALLYWNERNEVTSLRMLDLAARLLVEAPSNRADPALDGRLVHVTGTLAIPAPAHDPLFGAVDPQAVRLERQVEMFQWQEHSNSQTQKSVGGSSSSTTQTTYDYQRVWSDRAIDSATFHAHSGHANPPMPLSHLISDAADVRLGPYRLDAAVLDHLAPETPVALPEDAPLPAGWQRGDAGLFHGHDPMAPSVGDVRVTFRSVPAGAASIIAGQHADGLAAYQAPDGSAIALATAGTVSAPAMLSAERSQVRILAWILRLAGFGLSLAGLMLMMRPLAVLVSVLPVLETVVDVAATVVMAGVAALLTLGTIAIARIVLQPLLSLGLLAAGLVIVAGCVRLRRPRPVLAVPRPV